jgi:hypothetical protein
MKKNVVEYLARQPDLKLDLEAVDGTSQVEMVRLLSSYKSIGGCIILSAAITDGLFSSMTENNFLLSMNAKVGVYETFSNIFDTSKLDFLVAFSSVTGTFGTGGQTSYGA